MAALQAHPYHHDPEADDAVEGARSKLWFVTMVSNPARFKSRYALYRKFRQHITRDLKANLITVEVAHGKRDWQVTSGDGGTQVDPDTGVRTIDVQVASCSLVWLKECMQNSGAARLPADCEYVVFCDADVTFCHPHAVTEIIHALQVHKVVQPFETCCDLGPDGQVMQVHRSFGWCHAAGMEWKPRKVPVTLKGGKRGHVVVDAYGEAYPGTAQHGAAGFGIPWHPGFAMAFRRSTLDKLGGLFDYGALGAGDMHICAALVGKAHLSYPGAIHDNYKQAVLAWQARADKVVKRDFGYAKGNINHSFHGAKRSRQYISRWSCLVDNNFDPFTDMRKNAYGVWEICSDKVALRDAIRRYFASRNEDGTEM